MTLLTLYRRCLQWLSLPIILNSFFTSSVGREYGVNFFAKCLLLYRFIRNTRHIPTVSSWYEHLLIAQTILNLPPKTPGIIVECGAYKGGSSANLSLVCALTGRQLVIFDSFAGLPQPQPIDTRHHCPSLGEIHTYTQGAFTGSLSEVKRNLKLFGNLSVCTLIPGYFASTLPKFVRHGQPIACIFTDVDLIQSLKTCLRWLWPKLVKGGYWFTHEAQHLEIAQLFFDRSWWRTHLHQNPPGLVGAGSGIFVGLTPTALGFIRKHPSSYRIIPQLVNSQSRFIRN